MDEPKFEELYGRVVTIFRMLSPSRQRLLYKQVGECLFNDAGEIDAASAAKAAVLFRREEELKHASYQRECFNRMGIHAGDESPE